MVTVLGYAVSKVVFNHKDRDFDQNTHIILAKAIEAKNIFLYPLAEANGNKFNISRYKIKSGNNNLIAFIAINKTHL